MIEKKAGIINVIVHSKRIGVDGDKILFAAVLIIVTIFGYFKLWSMRLKRKSIISILVIGNLVLIMLYFLRY